MVGRGKNRTLEKPKMLYEPTQTKKYIAIGAAALAILALVFWGVQKMKPKPMETPPALQGSAQTPLSPEVQAQKQQDMQDAINKANTEAPQIDENEAAKRQQDMLNALNAANKK